MLMKQATRISIVSACLLWLTVAGCETLSARQRALLLEGERAFQAQDYRRSVEQLSAFIEQVPKRPETARAYYVRGMSRAKLGQRALAYADLEQAARQAPQPELTWQPHAALGILHFEDENWETAARTLRQAVERMPDVAPKDALLYRIGLCCERSGRWATALTPYREIVSRFPRGAYAEAAQRRLRLQANHFAVQCGVFSRLENAQKLVADLKRQGLQTYVRQEPRPDGQYYVVLEGRYTSYSQALAALARVRGYIESAVLWP